jgi:hypothetical protein
MTSSSFCYRWFLILGSSFRVSVTAPILTILGSLKWRLKFDSFSFPWLYVTFFQMYRRLALRPKSGATPEAEKAIGKAMGNYLAGGGCFQAWNDHIREGNILTVDEVRSLCPW